jgi:hypothetical protein
MLDIIRSRMSIFIYTCTYIHIHVYILKCILLHMLKYSKGGALGGVCTKYTKYTQN